MKLTIKFKDGVAYSGSSPTNLVESMRSSSPFTQDQTVQEYMHDYARRYMNLFGTRRILAFSPLAFLLTLASTDEVESLKLTRK